MSYDSSFLENLGLVDSLDEKGNYKASGHVIHITHLASGKSIQFRAFLTQFLDSFASTWNPTSVYGRMDDIYNFQQTRRTISLGWTAPSADAEEAAFNMLQAQTFVQMLYPAFQTIDRKQSSDPNPTSKQTTPQSNTNKQASSKTALKNLVNNKASSQVLSQTQGNNYKKTGSVISAPPLLRIKFNNIINNGQNPSGTSDSSEGGLIGFVDKIDFQPDMDSGWYGSNEDGIPLNNIVPKTLTFSCNFTVLHTNRLGWDTNGNSIAGNNFPYNAEYISNKVQTNEWRNMLQQAKAESSLANNELKNLYSKIK